MLSPFAHLLYPKMRDALIPLAYSFSALPFQAALKKGHEDSDDGNQDALYSNSVDAPW